MYYKVRERHIKALHYKQKFCKELSKYNGNIIPALKERKLRGFYTIETD